MGTRGKQEQQRHDPGSGPHNRSVELASQMGADKCGTSKGEDREKPEILTD